VQPGPQFADLIGRSGPISVVRVKLARLVTASEARLPAMLLQGETGTGKGLLARALHDASARSAGPFIDLNCAAVPPTLLESELFGHAEGAFTDARGARPGLVQAAHGGTLFLDEIGTLPPPLQTKLLKTIEEQVVRRVGATRTEAVDVWVVSASNEDLASAVGASRFRADLYHRLAGVTVTLPPLRDRGDDVLELAEHFLDRVTRAHGLPRPTLTDDARQALLAHDWPGNVRELGNLLERVVLLETGLYVTATMLGLPSVGAAVATGGSRQVASRGNPAQILGALEATGWNVSQAADRLGLSRNTLRYRMERLGLTGASSPRRRPKGFRWDGPGRPALERRVALLGVRVRGTGGSEHGLIAHTVSSLGGRIEDTADNYVLVVFGLRPDEQAPRRAAEAALDLLRKGAGSCLAAAVDVATFPLATRGVLRRQERAMVNATLRPLLERAEAGAVLASPPAAALLERHFSLQKVAGAGRTEVFRLVGLAAVAGAEPPRPMTPFVGRNDEFTLLEGAADDARAGRGQFIGVIGEPGAGKSRLVHEFCGRITDHGMRWVALSCVAHARGASYQPVIELLRRRWTLDVASPPVFVAATVRARVRELGLDVELATACLLRLLGIAGQDALAGLMPEAVGRATADALRTILLAGADPLVLAVDDLHCADESTQQLIGTLVDIASRLPLLIIATYRPGYRPPWIDRSSTTQLALVPLTAQPSAELVRAILDTPRQVDVDRLVIRGGGNPLFLEELAWALRQEGADEAGRVPDSLEDALTVQVGRLSPVARRLLSIAAVLAPEVPLRLLLEVAGERDTRRWLDELTRAELLRPDVDALVYSFRHGLIQQLCYARLPEEERRRLHTAAAAALERLWPGREDQVLDRLARHHAGAGHATRATSCLTRLAARATAAYALTEAVALLEQALDLARSLPEMRDRDRETVRIVQALAHPLILLGRFARCRELLASQREAVQTLADARLSCAHDGWLAMVNYHLGEPGPAVTYASKALRVALACDDATTAGRARMLLSFASFWAGDHRQSVELAAQAAAALDDPEEALWRGTAVYVGALNQGLLGHFDATLTAAAQLRRIGELAGERRLESYAYQLVGWIAAMRGDAETAVAACARAVEIAPDALAVGTTLYYLGAARLVAGDHSAARHDLERALELNRQLSFAPLECLTLGALGEAQLLSGDNAAGQRAAQEALALAERIAFAWGRGCAQRTLGRAARALGDYELAARCLQDSLETFTRLSAPWEMEVTARFMDGVPVST